MNQVKACLGFSNTKNRTERPKNCTQLGLKYPTLHLNRLMTVLYCTYRQTNALQTIEGPSRYWPSLPGYIQSSCSGTATRSPNHNPLDCRGTTREWRDVLRLIAMIFPYLTKNETRLRVRSRPPGRFLRSFRPTQLLMKAASPVG
jgi:hypothetical protein